VFFSTLLLSGLALPPRCAIPYSIMFRRLLCFVRSGIAFVFWRVAQAQARDWAGLGWAGLLGCVVLLSLAFLVAGWIGGGEEVKTVRKVVVQMRS